MVLSKVAVVMHDPLAPFMGTMLKGMAAPGRSDYGNE